VALDIRVTFDVHDLEVMSPRLFFQPVPEGKTAKNRVHLDVRASAGVEGEDGRVRARQHAQRLVEAGATILHEKDEPIGWCIVMTDPEGNEFCVT
jgi:Glyoxalase-like domain